MKYLVLFGLVTALFSATHTSASPGVLAPDPSASHARRGYVAGQAALTRYLGYQFRPWYVSAAASYGQRTAPLAVAAPAAHLAAFARLYPNPTAGGVQVDYHLPDAQTSGQLCLYDRLGHLLRTIVLTEHTGTAELSLSALPAGLYFYALQARGQLVAKGKLVKQL